jgi:outer membrane receptor protein involved in Fe transport
MATYTLKWNEKTDARRLVRAYRNAQHDVYDWKYPGEGIYDQEALAGEVQQSLWVTDRQRVTVGAEARQESVDIEEVSGLIDESTDTTGFYVQDEIHLTDALRATVGVRNDANTDYGDEWSPRASLLWQVSGAAEVFGAVNRAYRAPSLSDRFVRVVYNGMEFVGNPDLKAETLMAYEVGMRARPLDRLTAELAVFLNDMEDAFDFMMDPDGVFRNRNATRTRDYGVELSAEYAVSDALSFFANYSYTEGTYEEFGANPAVEGNQLAYLARDKAAAGVNFTCPLGIRNSLRARYVGPRFGDAQNAPENKMADYLVVDWHLRYPVGDHVELTLNLDNLFEETYQEFPRTDQPRLTALAGVEARF